MSKSRTARRQRDDAAPPPPPADAGEAPPGHDISLGRLAHYIGFRMRRVHDIQTREFMRLTRDENLTQGMFTALALISANPGSSQVRLAQEMGLHTSA
ncbi:MAG TPA: hypothetical protein VFY03_09235, partial [Woeseiaceae bacterium]|nr:hypothetical protein [Woeseiaceae bacterium]